MYLYIISAYTHTLFVCISVCAHDCQVHMWRPEVSSGAGAFSPPCIISSLVGTRNFKSQTQFLFANLYNTEQVLNI